MSTAFQQPRENILGTCVSAINMQQAVETIQSWIDEKSRQYVCVTPVHSVMDGYNDPVLRQVFNNSGLTTPDGMGVVWTLKLLGHKHVSRVYGPDLMLALSEASLEHGWTHYYFGGAPGVADKLAETLRSRCPGLKVAGTFSPPYGAVSPAEDLEQVNRINAAAPDIVWIGLSSPKQDYWMANHRGQITAPVLIGVGAAFDFLSGNKRQAPRWIQRSGLEWIYRFVQEPARLWKRYIQYPRFGILIVLQMLGLKRVT